MDYIKLGFKAGLEIHQQLDTGKLFCNCPGYLRKDEPDFKISRRLHKVAGETGEIDAAVAHEDSLKREFIYECYNDNNCLVEIDEEPPHKLSQEALDEALKIACLMKCEIYQASQIMRKTVIDGSNTSGFQRTVLIAHDGKIETSFGVVEIESIALEEDSARIISKDEKKSVYRLDRLGIPLVEITTKPTMVTPDAVKEAALKIGEILRACKVKRGIGTIRQDVNVNIKSHDKVEIKGFQDPAMMILTIDIEVERQKEELAQGKKEGAVRNALPDGKTEFLRPVPGKSRMYPETDLPLLKISRDKINQIKKVLPKLKTEIREELKKKGVTDELIKLVEENLDEFVTLMKVYDKDANLVAKMTTLWRNELASKNKKSFDEIKEALSERVLEEILEAIVLKKIEKGDVRKIMDKIYSGEKVEDALKVEKANDDEIEEEIAKIVKEKPGVSVQGYMGLVMAKFKGKIDGKKATEILKRILME